MGERRALTGEQVAAIRDRIGSDPESGVLPSLPSADDAARITGLVGRRPIRGDVSMFNAGRQEINTARMRVLELAEIGGKRAADKERPQGDGRDAEAVRGKEGQAGVPRVGAEGHDQGRPQKGEQMSPEKPQAEPLPATEEALRAKLRTAARYLRKALAEAKGNDLVEIAALIAEVEE